MVDLGWLWKAAMDRPGLLLELQLSSPLRLVRLLLRAAAGAAHLEHAPAPFCAPKQDPTPAFACAQPSFFAPPASIVF
eukprot:1144812-Pelagomonas_calceolata.AAC.1